MLVGAGVSVLGGAAVGLVGRLVGKLGSVGDSALLDRCADRARLAAREQRERGEHTRQ